MSDDSPAALLDQSSKYQAFDHQNLNLLKVCHVIACINQNIGGPALSVTNLTQALTQTAIEPHLWTIHYPQHGAQLKPAGVKLHSYPATFLTQHLRGFHPIADRALHQLAAQDIDLIHNHGVWMFPNLYARQAAKRYDLPLVISPRGMLEPWALQWSGLRKRVAWWLYERENLKQATLFHATSAMEVQAIRQLGFQQPIALIPNGVSIPAIDQVPSKSVLSDQFPALANKRWLLFLSRLHPKKGLNTLLKVWETLEAQFIDWQLVIAGPDLIGYQAQLVELTEKLNLQHRVTFTGMLSGDQKAAAFGNAELFVLPSHSENFGIAVAEALSYAVPAIATHGTPWEGLHHANCGWWIENNAETLKKALTEGMQLSDSVRRSMGLNGRALVTRQYAWSSIAQTTSAVYHWILQGGTLPDCIALD